jgi:hypothetical protein
MCLGRNKMSEFLKGEMIDRIEKNIQMTQDYVASAVEETKQAVGLQSKARRVRVYMLIKTNAHAICIN